MSRSKRKIPMASLCGIRSGTMKKYKQQEHGRERTYVRVMLAAQVYDKLETRKMFGNEWSSPRDGKMYFGCLPSYPHYDGLENWYKDYDKGMRK